MNSDLTLVFGLGKTGYSCVEWLSGNSPLAVVDTRLASDADSIPNLSRTRREHPEVQLHTVDSALRLLPQVSRLVVSPGVSLNHCLVAQARAQGVQIIGDIDLFMQSVDAPVYAITGTNGKSTTTALVGEMLKNQGVVCGGNFGIPALDLLATPARHYVLELSSFQLERWQTGRFETAVFLNVSTDHQDRHDSEFHYIQSKRRIFSGCGFAVYNGEDRRTKPADSVASIAVNEDPDWRVVRNGALVDGHLLRAESIALQGSHNHFNVVAAAAVAMRAGADFDSVQKVAASFTGLPHRAELVAELQGVRYVNDSKATNIGATVAALNGFSAGHQNVVLIAGGDGKNQNFEELNEAVRNSVKCLVVIGRDGPDIARATQPSSSIQAADMADAVSSAQRVAEAGDVVLLSPGCASFDMYEGFAARGDDFTAKVRELSDG